MAFTVPFYQYDKPCLADVATAVREEITRRRQMLLTPVAKPRKPKAPAMPGRQARDTALIRRIERQMEEV
jgi:hypothetical protein